jgi:hypothetical protein
MWTIEKLTKRFSMSDQQIYRRIQAAQRPLNRHINRGEKNAIELTEGGFFILENVIELEKQGKTLAIAVREVEKSVSNDPQPQVSFEMPGRLSQNTAKNGHKLPETDMQSLIEEIGYLKGILDGRDERMTEIQIELERLRNENDELKHSAAIVEYQVNQRKNWWPFR